MSRDWDEHESRWMCAAAAVAPRKFLKSVHLPTAPSNTGGMVDLPSVPASIECAKTSGRLKPEKWRAAFDKDGRAVGFQRALKAIVSGGVDHSIRAEVWEFLLGCYSLNSSLENRQQLRQARRQRYKELIQQCQSMHAAIGSGKLAYTVGSKVMDVRIMSKDSARLQAKLCTEAVKTVSLASQTSYEDDSPVFRMDAVDMDTYEDSRESFEDAEAVNADTSSMPVYDMATGSDDGSDSPTSEASDGTNGNPNYLRLPVRTLFPEYVMNREGGHVGDRGSTSGADADAVKEEAEKAGESDRHQTDDAAIDKTSVEIENPDVEGVQQAAAGASNGADITEEKVAEWLWTLHRIVVDVVRTDRHLKFYEDSKNMARMSDLLAVYAWVDPATGYCQGMSDLLSPFILLYEDDADAFWCFESLLRRVRQNFQMEGPIGVMRQLQALTTILELTDAHVFKHFVHIGADSFLFAFRMLLVLFRRELSFGEALCMWEMMWAADFDHGISWALEYNCPDPLIIRQPLGFPHEENVSEDLSGYAEIGQKPTSPLYGFHDTPDTLPPEDGDVSTLSRSPLCGLRAKSFWPRHSRHRVRTVSSLLGKAGDDELSVFVVAAILVLNRNKFIKEVHSMDDAIKAFNEIQMKIKVRHCIQTAIQLRRKYQKRLVRRAAFERRETAARQEHGTVG